MLGERPDSPAGQDYLKVCDEGHELWESKLSCIFETIRSSLVDQIKAYATVNIDLKDIVHCRPAI